MNHDKKTVESNPLTEKPVVDEHGHLLNWKEWSPCIAEYLASADEVQLTQEHWDLIRLLRDIFKETGETPPMRLFIRVIRANLGDEIASSRMLYRLFPDSPIKHLCRYAGLPKPPHCL